MSSIMNGRYSIIVLEIENCGLLIIFLMVCGYWLFIIIQQLASYTPLDYSFTHLVSTSYINFVKNFLLDLVIFDIKLSNQHVKIELLFT